MKDGWPGFLAIILFLILILLFLASTATPEITAEPQLLNNSGAATTATPAVNLNVAPTAQLIVNPTLATITQPAITPIAQPGSAVYVVQPGEWLADIARRHNTTVRAILAVNPQIINPDAIQPGETLVLP